MNGHNGVQMQVHQTFLDVVHKFQNERISMGKDSKAGANQLSTKRFSLTLARYILARPQVYNELLNADIDKNEK